MDDKLGDDCPPEYRLVRRQFLAGGAAVIATPSAAAAATAALPTAKFMEVSALLVNHRLNAELGARLAAGLAAADPQIAEDIEDILAAAHKNNAKTVEDFFPDLPAGRVKDAALAIISAWYSGVVSDAPDAEVYAFELALMYQPTSDVMTIPSYAISGPNGWNASGPPLNQMPEF
jgi:hypothetical protein